MSSIREAVDLLLRPGQVIEVRAISDEGMASGYFDNPREPGAEGRSPGG